MRSADQIGRTVEQYAEFKAAERRRALKELLAGLAHARANRVEWYTWVTEGMPRLTPEQYEAIKAKRRTRHEPA